MKNISLFLILFLICLNGCKTSKPVTVKDTTVVQQASPDPASTVINFSDPATWILGYFDLNRLFQPPHSTWFISEYDGYKYNSDAVNKLKGIGGSDITIKIVMGTWCPDSRREVPRFMRILAACGFPSGNVQLIGVDNSKISPVGDFDKLDIQRVPTFIFYKKNIEAGRIIENPTTSLEQDMVDIVTK
jgi:hypothetical protein